MADMGEPKVFEVGVATTEYHVYVTSAERTVRGRAIVEIWQVATDGRPVCPVLATEERDVLIGLGSAVVAALRHLPADEEGEGEG